MRLPKLLCPLTGVLTLGIALATLAPAGRAIAHPHDDEDDQDRRVRVERDGEEKRVIKIRDGDKERIIELESELSHMSGGFLGVMVQDVTRSLRRAMDLTTDDGALVNRVEEDSPADKAGLHKGDVIVEVDRKTIGGAGDLTRVIRNTDPGKEVAIVVIRDRNRETLKATLGKRPKSLSYTTPRIGGMRFRDLEDLGLDMPRFRENMQRMMERRDELVERLERLERKLERLSEQLDRMSESLEERSEKPSRSREDRAPFTD